MRHLRESATPPPEARTSYRAFTQRDLPKIAQLKGLDADLLLSMRAVASVLPFRVNPYVVEELIDWDDIPDDPVFQLTFPQPQMLEPADLAKMRALVAADAGSIKAAAREIQARLNPNPAGQKILNVPRLDGRALPGVQHKYQETVLFFPAQGQTCHAYCTYCFRWPQFVGIADLRFAGQEIELLVAYLRQHPEVTNVLITGGDPLIMKTLLLRRYLEPLMHARIPHLRALRIGSKALAYWPQRFVSDADADDLLRLFEEIQQQGLHFALMAHYSHPREMQTPLAKQALQRVLATGTNVRSQAPLIRHVNDSAEVWAELWKTQVREGAIPYYMFVERDTGPKGYFEVPLVRALDIFREAYRHVSGLARTVRGPSMSATPGKVVVTGNPNVAGEQVLALKFIQARNPEWVGRLFFAQYDEEATWLDGLRPAFGETEFFFEKEMRQIEERSRRDAEAQPQLVGCVEEE
jgi:KamA family protein